MLDQVHTRKD